MTVREFDQLVRRDTSCHAHGWTTSCVVHVLGAISAVLFLAEIEKPVLPKRFQWEVAMVQATPSVAPIKSPAAPSRPPTPKPVDRQVESSVTRVQQVAQEAPQPLERLMPVQHVPTEIVSPTETVIQSAPVVARHEQPAVVRESLASASSVVEPTVLQTASVASVTQAEPVEVRSSVTAAQQMTVRASALQESPVVELGAPAVQSRVVQQRLVRFRDIQADYGWLRESLFRRIEEVKRYPSIAKSNHWEGKVVLKAVVRADGSLTDLEVAESSGREVLDQEALATMHKLSPLTLTHSLGQAQVPILIPISYRLDG